jgi:hypothetical protein
LVLEDAALGSFIRAALACYLFFAPLFALTNFSLPPLDLSRNLPCRLAPRHSQAAKSSQKLAIPVQFHPFIQQAAKQIETETGTRVHVPPLSSKDVGFLLVAL